MASKLDLHFSSDSTEWETPQELFDALNKEFGFTIDVAASKKNAKCKRFWTKKDDCLSRPWSGVCWMNPPYNKPEQPCAEGCVKVKCQKHGPLCPVGCKKHRGHHIKKYIPGQIDFVRKAYEESLNGAVVVCLVPARTDTDIWHEIIFPNAREIRFLRGRLNFGGGDTTDPAPFPSAIVIFGRINPNSKAIRPKVVAV